jgi:2-dehydropantoate 2-reductase
MSGRILVVGAGATGGFFGARLAQHGRDVTFLVREARAAALREHGLRVTGLGRDDVISPQVVTAAALDARYDVILLAVKATALGPAISDLGPAVGNRAAIVPFLNGMGHLAPLNERFGPDRVLGGVVKVATELDADGTIRQLAPSASMVIGEQNEPHTARVARLAELLSGAGFDVSVSSDITAAMWHKWVFIAAIGALTGLLRGSVGEIVAQPSLSRDLRAGRHTEVEPILGDLARRAARAGLAAPLIDLATLALRVHESRLGTPPGS